MGGLTYASYGIFGITAIYFLCLCCNYSRIELAIAVNQVACKFVSQTPTALAVPPIQIVFCIIWWLIWGYIISYIVTFPSDQIAAFPAVTYAEAAGVSGSSDYPGVCACVPDCAPRPGYYKTQYTLAEYAALGEEVSYKDAEGKALANIGEWEDTPAFKCKRVAYTIGFNPKFWFAALMLLWINAYVIAFGQITIAGGVSIWYFTNNNDKMTTPAILIGAKNAIRYHAGTVALGSLILALVQLVKYFLYYLSEQAKKQNNKVMEYLLKCLAYLVWCFEQCVKFLNKHAYIQTALNGTKFCVSAKNAFWLLFRNAGRVATVGLIAPVIHGFGLATITIGSCWAGYMMCNEMYGEPPPTGVNSIVGPCICYTIIGYVAGKLIMNVFGLAVDTILQCFIADEELGGSGEGYRPEELQKFLDSDEYKKENEKNAPKKEGAQQ